MAVSLLCSVASVAAGLVPFYAVYRIIDEVIAPAPDGGAVLAWVGAAAAGYVASKVLFGASTLLSHVSAYTILESLRDDVVEKLMKTSLGTAASKSIGQIKNVFVDRIEGVEVPLAHMIPELSGNVLLAAAIAVWMALIDWRIALACLVTVPIGLVVFASGLGAYNRMYAAYMAEGNHVNSVMVEYVEGIQVIKAFNQGSNSYQKYANAVRSFKDFTLGWFKATWVSMNLAFSILPTTLLGVLPVGLALYLAGDVTPAELGLEFVLALAVVAPLMKLSSFLNEAKAMEYAVADASEFLDLPELPEPAQRAAVRDEGVELANVSFSYESGEEVLHDVSLRVPRGSFCALVGPSGSGKSTLARLIARHWDVGAGAVRVGGVDVRDMPLDQLSQLVSFVAQDNYLFDCSLRENIRPRHPQGRAHRGARRGHGLHRPGERGAHPAIHRPADARQDPAGHRAPPVHRGGGRRHRGGGSRAHRRARHARPAACRLPALRVHVAGSRVREGVVCRFPKGGPRCLKRSSASSRGRDRTGATCTWAACARSS